MKNEVKQGRLDIRKCSNEGVARLINGIFKQTISDWNESLKSIKKRGINDKDLYELKKILDFIQSDYFIALTNANCPQRDCVDGLIAKIENRDLKELLMNYALVNEAKWHKTVDAQHNTVILNR